jgi:hypothetical protein
MAISFAKASFAGIVAVSFGLHAEADLQQGAAAAAQAAMPIAMMAAVSSGATATALKFPCVAQPPNALACTMMGLAVVQVGMALAQHSGDKSSAGGLSGNYNFDNSAGTPGAVNADPSATYTTPDGTTINGDYAKIANNLAGNGLGGLANDYASDVNALKGSGVTVSPDGTSVTTADGKKVTASSLGSESAMKAAGFSGSDISGAQNALKNVPAAISALKASAMTNDVGGGGGGLGSGGGGGGGGSGSGGSFAGFGKAAKGQDISLSGMSKKLGNDNIGVAGDDIFEMITRRYKARDKVDAFIKK